MPRKIQNISITYRHTMITLFTMPKPFEGHIDIIQRNAIKSWTLLHPEIEVLLLGDERGTREVAKEFGVGHLPEMECNGYGTPLVKAVFENAERAAQNQLLTYVNADIILLDDFVRAVKRIAKPRFLMGGQRWDFDLNTPLDFNGQWQANLASAVRKNGRLHGITGIDYFVFKKGLFGEIPDFALGRFYWDNWLLYRARQRGGALIDSTGCVMAVHQNHSYAHVDQAKTAHAAFLSESFENRCMIRGTLFSLNEANWRLSSGACHINFPLNLSRAVNEFALQCQRHGFLLPFRKISMWASRQLWDRRWKTRYASIIK